MVVGLYEMLMVHQRALVHCVLRLGAELLVWQSDSVAVSPKTKKTMEFIIRLLSSQQLSEYIWVSEQISDTLLSGFVPQNLL